jgi:hypothetical protein
MFWCEQSHHTHESLTRISVSCGGICSLTLTVVAIALVRAWAVASVPWYYWATARVPRATNMVELTALA